ncbi:hypothetical protein [Bacillus sp. 165]|uniref:hypothetical protein n=1 Tax=Bacillus sp. 165 TaxID=1529117 RepID=UPI001ADBB319|nr:hypothetical protein [Bacillus sp. 165]MBO9128324.1 hypothetical protein [Bacillus sp. 165]
MNRLIILACVSLMVLTGCAEPKVKEVGTLQEIRTEKIIVWKNEAVVKEWTDEEKIKPFEQLLEEAKRVEAIFSLSHPEYKVVIHKEKKQEKYFLWLHHESRQGWMMKQGDDTHLYHFSKDITKELIEYIEPTSVSTPSSESKLKSITKQDFQITKFHIISEPEFFHYRVSYTISDSLYAVLEKEKMYYFQLEIPKKVQALLKEEKSVLIEGEQVGNEYKTYEIHFLVPKPKNMTASQEQAIMKYYEGYNLTIWNEKKEQAGTFLNIIQYVKEYGEKLERKK